MSLIGIILVFYFCYSQFKMERPKRFRYLLLPLYALFMFLKTFELGVGNLWLAVLIIVIGAAIGSFQGAFAQIESQLDDQNHPRVSVRGGWPFLMGWGLIVGVQILLTLFLAHQSVNAATLSETILHSALEELLPFRRINAFNWWVLWALSGSASLAYTGMLAYRSPEVCQALRAKRRSAKTAQKHD